MPDDFGDRLVFERRYRDNAERFIMESRGAELHEGAMRSRWRITFRGATQELVRDCVRGVEGGDPHFGWIPGLGREQVLDTPTVWAIPWRLDVGTTWRGETHTELRLEGLVDDPVTTLVAQRTFSVVGRERVVVPAGAFDAWHVRIDSRESQDDESPVHVDGHMWLAPGIGMVRELIEVTPEHSQEMVAVEWTPAGSRRDASTSSE